jgi:two-component system nitrogen regulation response regulator GlnG/two-component system response regulator HydG
VIVSCPDEPWRIGEAVVVGGRDAPAGWFGRASDGADAEPRCAIGRLRGDQLVPSPPIGIRAISRNQLALRVVGGRLRVENHGQCPLFCNELPAQAAEVEPGDLLRLGSQLLLLYVRRIRPVPLSDGAPREAAAFPDFPFGKADPFGMVGESEAAWALRHAIASVATREGHLLVTGPSGAGKELVARAVHSLSPRASKRMIARNAATLPETLIDAELFGNARNYPNAGMPERRGLIGEADGTSLFLDEIGELPPTSQAHLLRVLDAGEYQRLGDARSTSADFRLIAATNRDPSLLKHDFLARFTLRLDVPDLNARREDIPLIVRHLQSTEGSEQAPPSVEATRLLLRHDYRTNVRELRLLLAQCSGGAHAGGAYPSLSGAGGGGDGRGDPSQGAPHAYSTRPPPPAGASADPFDADAGERQRIEAALAACGGNQTRAAKLLGVARSTLVLRLDALGLTRPRKH